MEREKDKILIVAFKKTRTYAKKVWDFIFRNNVITVRKRKSWKYRRKRRRKPFKFRQDIINDSPLRVRRFFKGRGSIRYFIKRSSRRNKSLFKGLIKKKYGTHS